MVVGYSWVDKRGGIQDTCGETGPRLEQWADPAWQQEGKQEYNAGTNAGRLAEKSMWIFSSDCFCFLNETESIFIS